MGVTNYLLTGMILQVCLLNPGGLGSKSSLLNIRFSGVYLVATSGVWQIYLQVPPLGWQEFSKTRWDQIKTSIYSFTTGLSQEVGKRLGSVGYSPNIPHL